MIINQAIKNGICNIAKRGQYFQLLSAFGVVRVRLLYQGSVKFESEMWVGMNLDKPIDFDQIEISGIDGGIQLWAGTVAMSNAAFINIRGANAVRTKTVDVLGEKELTSSDLTRQSIRLRTNKDVYLGGSGVNGKGWRLTAGETEEIPVAGSLYAYKKLPELNIENATVINNYPKSDGGYNEGIERATIHVSKDGSTILAGQNNWSTPWRISTDYGVTWAAPDWLADPLMVSGSYHLIYHRAQGKLYLLTGSGGAGAVRFFVSSDNGVTFKYLITALASLGGEGSFNNYPTGHIVGNKLFFDNNKFYGLLDLDTLTFSAITRRVNLTAAIAKVVSGVTDSSNVFLKMTSEDGLRMVATLQNPSRRTIASNDGGKTWSLVVSDYLVMEVEQSGENICGIPTLAGTRYPYFSNDGGLSFVQYAAAGGVSVNPAASFYRDMWLKPKDGALLAFYLVNGEYAHDEGAVTGLIDKQAVIINDAGHLITGQASSGSVLGMQRVEFTIDGDLSPALVEIMELLN